MIEEKLRHQQQDPKGAHLSNQIDLISNGKDEATQRQNVPAEKHLDRPDRQRHRKRLTERHRKRLTAVSKLRFRQNPQARLG